MKEIELEYFKVSGINQNGVAMITVDTTTADIDMTGYSAFQVQVTRSLTDGTVSYCVESSNDGVYWARYCPIVSSVTRGEPTKSQDMYPPAGASPFLLPLSGSGNNQSMVIERECNAKFLRLNFTVSGSPTGTYAASIIKSKQ